MRDSDGRKEGVGGKESQKMKRKGKGQAEVEGWDGMAWDGMGCDGMRGHYPPKRMILEVRRKEKGTP